MATIDLTPLYRSSVGFDRLANMIDSAMRADQSAGYPPYNIEVTGDDEYGVTLAVAGFAEDELDIQVEGGVLTVRGKKGGDAEARKFLHQGIAFRSFERRFNLADHIKVAGASLNNGLLTVALYKEVPEEMKPRSIAINSGSTERAKVLEHKNDKEKAA
ncbi:Hsp20 family protein [Salinispirillum sp. LH 10-3-1]|uniref:Hsp20 family protein n=1 Tax=Salinispirillum sp. LH 10-3-1 TaxID=2952525 RepID=A0AB38YHX7_9GAMM